MSATRLVHLARLSTPLLDCAIASAILRLDLFAKLVTCLTRPLAHASAQLVPLATVLLLVALQDKCSIKLLVFVIATTQSHALQTRLRTPTATVTSVSRLKNAPLVLPSALIHAHVFAPLLAHHPMWCPLMVVLVDALMLEPAHARTQVSKEGTQTLANVSAAFLAPETRSMMMNAIVHAHLLSARIQTRL